MTKDKFIFKKKLVYFHCFKNNIFQFLYRVVNFYRFYSTVNSFPVKSLHS